MQVFKQLKLHSSAEVKTKRRKFYKIKINKKRCKKAESSSSPSESSSKPSSQNTAPSCCKGNDGGKLLESVFDKIHFAQE